jgi:hypothetical protein
MSRNGIESRRASSEAGIALIMALLAIMVLTVMGLTLAATTSTEVQVAANYRWSQEALYNAEAGIEIAKHILRTADWKTLGVLARSTDAEAWDPSVTVGTALPAPGIPGTRHHEMGACDNLGGGMGYGLILNGLEYQTAYLGQGLNGAFTLWFRWPLQTSGDGNGKVREKSDEVSIIVVSEGIAPREAIRAGGGVGATVRPNRAVQVIEATLYNNEYKKTCGQRQGQVGAGAAGAGLDTCNPITAAGVGLGLGITGLQ